MKLSSTATNTGSATITIYFNQGTDPDMAAVNVQNLEDRLVGRKLSERLPIHHEVPRTFEGHDGV